MDYTTFKANDFIQDDYFLSWVKHPNHDDDIFWEKFTSDNSAQKVEIEKAKMFILAAQSFPTELASEQQKQKMWSVIEENTQSYARIIPFWQSKGFMAAASIVFLLLFGGFYWYFSNDTVSNETLSITKSSHVKGLAGYVETSNLNQKSLDVTLSDGSVVTLEKNSSLSYPQDFAPDKRVVYLKGEAFFEVTKNPNKPFYVYANEIVTKVLGTSFRIKAFEGEKNITVAVKTGKVSVFSPKLTEHLVAEADPETQGVVLTPNQQVVYMRQESRLVKMLIEKPSVIITKEQLEDFVFENAPVPKIFSAIEKAYGVDIVYDDDLMANCMMTTTLTEENLFDKLNIICKILGASYKVVDAQIVIDSKGCQ